SDTAKSQPVALVSESLARKLWPGENPIGKIFNMALSDRSVIGVVGDIRVRGLERESEPQVYMPYRQMPDGGLPFYIPKYLVLRTAGSARPLESTLRSIVAKADPELPIANIRTLTDVVRADSAPRSTQIRVIGAFALLALLLAGIGIHGLLAFAVAQRAPEI